MKYEESFQELKHASIGMEKPKSYYLDPPPLPPEDLEPATSGSQNKNEINTMNQMNQMMMHGRGNFNPFSLGWEVSFSKPDTDRYLSFWVGMMFAL